MEPMNTLENKHLLGGLTLRDLKEKIESLRVWCVEIDWEHWERFQFNPDKIELWKANSEYEEDFPADEAIDLDTPAKVRDGKVIITDPVTGTEQEMVFGRMQFIPQRIEIP
jgi:hypothetical protein